MASKLAVLLLLAAATGSLAQSAKTDVGGTLNKEGFKLAAALFDIAGLTQALNNPAGKYTLLVPNDAAVTSFLGAMGLTVNDLKARPGLAKKIAAQHIILGSNVRAQEIFAAGDVREVNTLAGRPNEVLFRKLANGDIKVTDFQGNVANVRKNHFVIDDNKSGHGIDKVLYSDEYYTDFASLCRQRKTTLTDFCKALVYAGLNDTVNAKGFENTVFVPNNKAFTKLDLGIGKVPPPAKAAEVLSYHVVKGVKPLPSGFKSGESVDTLLAGQDITVQLEKGKAAATVKKGEPMPIDALVVDAKGDKVPVVKPNVYVGKSIAHGIESILQPGAAAAPAATPAAAAAKPATTTTTPAPAPATKPAGRRLLGFGWADSGDDTAEMDNAANAITLAADGDISPADAANQSLLGAEALSVPGAYDDGIGDW